VSAPKLTEAPFCAHCNERPATCIGEYETCTGVDTFACDVCCAHGNEDGHCRPLTEASK
jgi:hypothetical protein